MHRQEAASPPSAGPAMPCHDLHTDPQRPLSQGVTDNSVLYPCVIENDSSVINSNQVKLDGNLKRKKFPNACFCEKDYRMEKKPAIDGIFSIIENTPTQLSTLF